MVSSRSSADRYQFRDLRRGAVSGQSCARFAVEDPTGQVHEQLLNFTVLETRILIWDEASASDPELAHKDPVGFANYRQYVRALIEALRQQAI